MIYEKSIKKIESLLQDFSLKFLCSGVSWGVTTGETTQSCYILHSDTVFLNPKDIGWSWAYGRSALAPMFHELGHRFAEKILSRTILREKSVSSLFGYYHQKYVRKLRYASTSRKRELYDVVSRYSLVHPADDFAETFSVCLQFITKNRDPIEFVRENLKSELCKNKIEKILSLIEKSKQ